MRGSDLLPLGARMVTLIKGGMDHYVTMSGIPQESRRVLLVAWIDAQMDEWNPVIKGVPVLDDETKEAAARFMGGVAFLVADEMNKRGAA
jgi:hypothetical protein